MSRIVSEVLAANDAYPSRSGARAKLTGVPQRSFAILTCMDARMDPFDAVVADPAAIGAGN